MKTKIKTLPSQYPITLEEGKKQAEIDSSDDTQDTYVKSIITAATSQAEQYLHRRLVTQTWKLYLDCWPYSNLITLPFGQLQSVTSIKYKDTDGDETTLDPSEYIVDTESEPGQIVLGYQESWPTTELYPVSAITIEFICGYYIGTTWELSTAYAEGSQVLPITENGLVYQSDGGTSDATEPVWPLEIGETVVDNDITWTCLGIAIPEPIRHAIKLHVADFFEYRETEYFGMGNTKMETWEALLFPYKLWGGVF